VKGRRRQRIESNAFGEVQFVYNHIAWYTVWMIETSQTRAASAASPGSDRIHALLLNQILSGELAPGSRLVEGQLTRKLGLSRTPVREALFRLEQEGFVETQLHRGFRVAPLSETEARQIYPIVGALEALAIAEGGTLISASLPALMNANEKLRRAIHEPEQAVLADAAFHEALVTACPNIELRSLLDRFHQRAFRYEQLFMREGPLVERSVAQHEAIIQAISSGNIERAQAALQINYQSGMESVIARLRMSHADNKSRRPSSTSSA
jgi:DNA-binding GntR family transcriptional regulator